MVSNALVRTRVPGRRVGHAQGEHVFAHAAVGCARHGGLYDGLLVTQCASTGAAAPGFGRLSNATSMNPSAMAKAVPRKPFEKLSAIACAVTFSFMTLSARKKQR